MPRLFTMGDNNAPSEPTIQHAPPNSHSQMQRMQPPAPFHPFMAPNGSQMRTKGRNSGHGNTGPTPTSHTMFANQLPGQTRAVPLNPPGLSFEFKRAAQAQAQATRSGPPGPGRLPSGNYHHGGGAPSTMGPPNSVREQQASAPPPMEQLHNERYGGVPNQSWSPYPGNQQQSEHHHRMMYQDPGRGTPYHPNPTNHSYSHPNNTRRSSFPVPPPHAFYRLGNPNNGRSSNPMMQPPNRRFTFHAITAPSKLMEQNQASRSPSPTGIPAPPLSETVSTNTNHQGPKHDIASNKKVKDSEKQDQQAPLRESGRHNVPSQTSVKEQRDNDASTTGGKPSPFKKAPVPTCGTTNVDTASILLELRTSNSGSPVTTTDVNVNENNLIVKTANATTAQKEELEGPPPAIETANLVPKNYPKRLALEDDDNKLNTLHCFIRSELLEIFVVDQSICSSPTSAAGSGSALGRVGLRCVHCAQERKRLKVSERNEAPMAVFYPKCVSEIYRLITSWQRCHLRKCRNLPPAVREQWDELRKEDRSRGKTAYWVTSATQLGLVDCQSKGRGVRFSAEMMTEHNGEHS
jgi:hypothetical protein